MIKQIDGLLFDMDGILVDVTGSYRIAIQKTASYFLNRKVNMDEINEIKSKVGMNNDWDATYSLINNKSIPYNTVKNIFQKIYWGVRDKRGLITNERILISKNQLILLKNKFGRMGIATGRPRVEAEYVINQFELTEIFMVMIAKEDAKKEKPFPDPLLQAMKGMKTNNVVYIGDSSSDVVAANAAKIPCIYVGDLQIGTVRFSNVSKVIRYLL